MEKKLSNWNGWQPIIGLEIHCELNTLSKLFSPARNRFGDEPNANVSEICTGMPGALPCINEQAIFKAVQFGCAIHANIAEVSTFDRKSYFYPDSPRNFQITQFENPIIRGGYIRAEIDNTEHTFYIKEAHIEDDSGMLKHFSNFAGVDFNRAGVPLIEIVSEPCMHSPKEASIYAQSIRALCEALDISDCNMEEGSLRFDVNVSVRKIGEPGFRNKIEIKNMNSFSNLEQAIAYEIQRQISEYEKQPNAHPDTVIKQSTCRWVPEKGITVVMRTKETADDYRYFPEPDLLPLVLTKEYIENIRINLPELPKAKEKRYIELLGIAADMAFYLSTNKALSKYFDSCMQFSKNAKSVVNWMLIEFAGRLKEKGKTIATSGIIPEYVAELINMIDDATINGKIAKTIADEMVLSPTKSPKTIFKNNPQLQPLNDPAAISTLIEQVLAENEQSIRDYLAGKDRAFAFLIGKVMQLTKGAASPQIVNELLREKIEQYKSRST